jgi:N-acyl-D-aspartate/D-glutamate deacylase
MDHHFDLIIRNGTIFDGTGSEPRDGDVAISGARIVEVGTVSGTGTEEIDAKGMIVTPGFVDLHTHYDAQVTWSSEITPSSWNGVTTAMIGNCGVGFAPCKPEQRDMLVKLMEGVEDIPEVVLTQGLPWNWESFEEYLDVLEARPYDLDVVTQVPHAALRVFVMGQRGSDREPATADDRARMGALAAAGVKAGALGFSTSRTINHKTLDGRHIPTLKADEAELTEIAQGLAKAGSGWLQVISDFDEPEEEMALLRRLVERSRRPMSITILQRDNKPEEWRRLMACIAEAQKAGLPMMGQVLTRPTGIMLGFEISQNPFVGRPSWKRSRPCLSRRRCSAWCNRSSARGLSRRRLRTRRSCAVSRSGSASSRFAIRQTTSRRPSGALPPLLRAKGGSPPKLPTTCCLRRVARQSSIGR